MDHVQAYTTTVPRAADEETRAVLLARSGLLDPAPDPELDHWTSVLRRATGASVVAVCIETSRRARWSRGCGPATRATPRRPSSPPVRRVEQFLTARIPPLATRGSRPHVPRGAGDRRRSRALHDRPRGPGAARHGPSATSRRSRTPPRRGRADPASPGQPRRAPLPRARRLPQPRPRVDRGRRPAARGARRAGRGHRAPRPVGDRLRGAARPRGRRAPSRAPRRRFRPTISPRSTAS